MSPDVTVDAALFEAQRLLDHVLATKRPSMVVSDAELAAWRQGVLAELRAWLTWELWTLSRTVH